MKYKSLFRFSRRAIVTTVAGFSLSVGSIALGQEVQGVPLKIAVPSVVSRSFLLNHTNPSLVLHLAVSLPYADPVGMQAFADSVSDPKSPNYRHFIGPEEVGSRFGLPQGILDSVANYLKSKGFTIRLESKNHLDVLADGTVSQAESAFGTTINDYQAINQLEPGNTRFYSFSTALSLPGSIAPHVLDVEGLQSFTKPHPLSTLSPTQARFLYNSAPAYNAGLQGVGRNVAISNFDGFRLTNVPLFYTQFGLPTPKGGVGSNISVIPISGGSGSGTPGGEGDLDIQMVLGMAPLNTFRIYDGGPGALIATLTQEANDDMVDIISESYGWNLPSSTADSAHNQHLSMSAEGITYLVASGDSGTQHEPFAYPDYDPEVMQVGGTNATVSNGGARQSEVGWGGSGGGWTTESNAFNKRPSWQVGRGVLTNVNFRMGPDVALHASGGGGVGAYWYYVNGVLSNDADGTSFACPVFAGSLATTEQKIISFGGLPPDKKGHRRFGRIQNLIYSQNGRPDVWFDIVAGDNGALPDGTESVAHSGWDTVCGWGAINFDAFARSVVAAVVDSTASSITMLEGRSSSGTVADTYAADAKSFNVNSQAETGIGQVASAIVTFQPAAPKRPIQSAQINYLLSAPVGVSDLIYMWNWSTNSWDFNSSAPPPSANGSRSLALSGSAYNKYVSPTGQVRMLFRGIFPQHINNSPAPFTFMFNWLQLTRTEL